MPDVLVVEPRQTCQIALQRIFLTHVPIRDNLLAVRIRLNAKHDHIIQKAQRLGVIRARQLIHRLHELLRPDSLVRMQAAVDPHHCFAFARELVCLLVGQTLGQRKLAIDLLIMRELALVLGRRQNRHVLMAAFAGHPDVHQLHSI